MCCWFSSSHTVHNVAFTSLIIGIVIGIVATFVAHNSNEERTAVFKNIKVQNVSVSEEKTER
jgi:uncharacterized membrane-anchored protein YhcB (DUF1043 family)